MDCWTRRVLLLLGSAASIACGDDASPADGDTGAATSAGSESGEADGACACVGDSLIVNEVLLEPCATGPFTDCGYVDWVCDTLSSCADATPSPTDLFVVDCVATAVGAGDAAVFGVSRGDEIGQFSVNRWSYLMGDGTAVSGGSTFMDIPSSQDSVVLHDAPTVEAVQACRDETSIATLHDCLDALTNVSATATCAQGTF